jgi:hypothetical protein
MLPFRWPVTAASFTDPYDAAHANMARSPRRDATSETWPRVAGSRPRGRASRRVDSDVGAIARRVGSNRRRLIGRISGRPRRRLAPQTFTEKPRGPGVSRHSAQSRVVGLSARARITASTSGSRTKPIEFRAAIPNPEPAAESVRRGRAVRVFISRSTHRSSQTDDRDEATRVAGAVFSILALSYRISCGWCARGARPGRPHRRWLPGGKRDLT